MGADAVVVFYGVKCVIDVDADAAEEQANELARRARKHKLDEYFGRLTDGEPHFVLIGKEIGTFGVENDPEKSLPAAELQRIAMQTRERLVAAGFHDEPALLIQLDAQY
jgi:hypothetical protein